jgi:anti-sigma-K factor RskA
VLTVWVALVVLVSIVAFWRHNSVAEIVTTVVAVSLVLAVVGLLMDRRNATPGAVVPIEAAE